MIVEELPRLAAESFRLALRECYGCTDYHATFTYLRAAGVRRGAGVDREVFSGCLDGLGPRPRILLAGSADTGQLAMIANALPGRDISFTIVDRCNTPLQLCAGFAARNGLKLETRRGDIAEAAGLGPFDAIVAHQVLGFVAPGERLAIVAALHDALAPKGLFVVVQRVRADGDYGGADQPPAEMVPRAMAAFRDKGIELPEDEERFARRIRSSLSDAEQRENAFETTDAILGLIAQAGFHHVSATRLDDTVSGGNVVFTRKSWMRRHLFVARKPGETGNY